MFRSDKCFVSDLSRFLFIFLEAPSLLRSHFCCSSMFDPIYFPKLVFDLLSKHCFYFSFFIISKHVYLHNRQLHFHKVLLTMLAPEPSSYVTLTWKCNSLVTAGLLYPSQVISVGLTCQYQLMLSGGVVFSADIATTPPAVILLFQFCAPKYARPWTPPSPGPVPVPGMSFPFTVLCEFEFSFTFCTLVCKIWQDYYDLNVSWLSCVTSTLDTDTRMPQNCVGVGGGGSNPSHCLR